MVIIKRVTERARGYLRNRAGIVVSMVQQQLTSRASGAPAVRACQHTHTHAIATSFIIYVYQLQQLPAPFGSIHHLFILAVFCFHILEFTVTMARNYTRCIWHIKKWKIPIWAAFLRAIFKEGWQLKSRFGKTNDVAESLIIRTSWCLTLASKSL